MRLTMSLTVLFAVLLGMAAVAKGQAAGSALTKAIPMNSPYDKAKRPSALDGKADSVDVALSLLHMYDVSDKGQSVDVDILMVLRWVDKRIFWTPSEYGGREKRRASIDDIWRPNMMVFNGRQPPEIVSQEVELFFNGNVTFIQRMTCTVNAMLDLRHFPFDHHYVPVKVSSFSYGADDVALNADYDNIQVVLDELSTQQWIAREWKVRAFVGPSLLSPRDAFVQGDLLIVRRTQHAIVQIVVPMILIVFASMGAFFMSLKVFHIRAFVGIVSMLTIMAFMNMVGKLLPPISYLSWIHYYTVGCFFFVFSSLCESVMMHNFDRRQKAASESTEETDTPTVCGIVLDAAMVKKMDDTIKYAWPITFLCFNIIMIIIEAKQISF